jgi:uncharacterized protein YndB with AHSA1/START domain
MGERVSKDGTAVERRSEREVVVTRTFNAPVRLVYEAWSKPELFQLWWAPKSNPVPLLSCEMDVRTGGGYRLTFGRDAANAMTFFGKYLDVAPLSRMVWTNDEGDEGSVTTVLVLSELYPSKDALDQSFVGMEDSMPEQFGQLDELLIELSASA